MNLSFEQPLHYGRLHCQGNDFLFRNSQKSNLPDNNQFQPDMRNKTGTFKLLDCTVDIYSIVTVDIDSIVKVDMQ